MSRRSVYSVKVSATQLSFLGLIRGGGWEEEERER